jgi:uncharacterized protein (TIGR02145 family)
MVRLVSLEPDSFIQKFLQIMKHVFIFASLLFTASALRSQVEVDQKIQLTGSGANAKIEGIQEVSQPQDAASKEYVDNAISDAVSALAGGEDPCDGASSVTYWDQTYAVIAIGDQCWFAENLNTDKRPNGTAVPRESPNNVNGNYALYGSLYKWADAMNSQTSSWNMPSGRRGICPPDWHIPSDVEWQQLIRNAGTPDQMGMFLKENNTTYWFTPLVAMNSTGFSARGAGGRSGNGNVVNFRSAAFFWSSTENYTVNSFAITYRVNYNTPTLTRTVDDDKLYAYSVRCVKD